MDLRKVKMNLSHPSDSNTYLLEKYFNWKGLGYEVDENYVDIYNKNRVNKCKLQDALNTNFHKFIFQETFLKILIIYK